MAISRPFQFGIGALVTVVIGAALINLLPFGVPFNPVPFATGHLPQSPLPGDQDVNAQAWEALPGEVAHPEDIVVDPTGALLVGASNGSILRYAADKGEWEVFAEVGGRPLGLYFDADGSLLVANNALGVQRVLPNGTVELVADTVEGTPIGLANGITVAADGTIYVTDSSTRYNPSTIGIQPTYALPDLLEGRPYGRVIRIDSSSGEARVIADGLYFPNSLVMAPDGRSVIFAESSRFRLLRLWVAGPEEGQVDILIDALPGNPDGLDYDNEGQLMLTLYDHVGALNNLILPYGLSRRILTSLPRSWFVNDELSGFVAIIDPESFEIVRILRDTNGYAPSNVVQVGNDLYSGTLVGNHVMRTDYF